MRRIFLDHNSTTMPLPEVVDAVARHSVASFANAGSLHAEGRIARRALEESRERIAQILGADPREVIFTSGGTEAINLAVLGLAADGQGRVLLTAGEHPATRQACRRLERRGWKPAFLDVDSQGRIVWENLDKHPWSEIKLATAILAHNETGVIQDLAPLIDRCRNHRVAIHVDAVQAVGKIAVNFAALDATALSLAGHKFGGPRGIGALLVRQGAWLRPRHWGGHQESGRRAGTESVALAVGMAVALEKWHAEGTVEEERLRRLRDRFEQKILARCPWAIVNAALAPRLCNTSNIAFPGVDGEPLLVALDLAGLACSLGSTCASGSAEPAPVLIAMGCPPEVLRSSVRFSLGWNNSTEEIDEAVVRIAECVDRLRDSQRLPSREAASAAAR